VGRADDGRARRARPRSAARAAGGAGPAQPPHHHDAQGLPERDALALAEAARALGRSSIEDLLVETGAALGRPWRKDHQVAIAAALAIG
jgi:hypothetical protein